MHVNRIRPQTQLSSLSGKTQKEAVWEAPSIEHDVIGIHVPSERRYPTRNRKPLDQLIL